MQLVFKGGYFGAANKFQKGKTHKQSSKHSGIQAIMQASFQAFKQSQSKENAYGEF
jgi:hypothetical protein